jgi:L-alanine-DL-glutamate epimerase-like enolase superfamily enzyme
MGEVLMARIADVEAIVLRQPIVDASVADGSQDDALILVVDDDGQVGVGEVDSAPEVVKAVVDAPASHANATGLRAVAIGRDAADISGLWEAMYRASIYYGRRGVALHAMSGIEMALWDLQGKRAGVPVSHLLGKLEHEQLRAYASQLMPGTESRVSQLIEQVRGEGFSAVKLGWGPLGQDVDNDIRLVAAAVRASAGELRIMVDAGLGYHGDLASASRASQAFQDMGVVWLEEPFEPDETELYAQLADSVDLPIAAGEHETTLWGFRELIANAHLDIVQPDVTRCGGLREALRIARYAVARGCMCVTHGWKTGIVKAASLHVNAVLAGAEYLEYCVAATPLNQHLTAESFPLENGLVRVPTQPGLGVTLDWEVVQRYAITPPRISEWTR